jgi:pimeloyl-ACP methyl ester carboxylesterase
MNHSGSARRRPTAEPAEQTALFPDPVRRLAGVDSEPGTDEIVQREPMLRLRHYESEADSRKDLPVVFVSACINTPAIPDVDEEHTIVSGFLDGGFDVSVVDWEIPSDRDSTRSRLEFLVSYLDDCVDSVRDRTGADGVFVVGVRTGPPLAAAYSRRHPEKIRGIASREPPLEFDVEGGGFDVRDVFGGSDHRWMVGDSDRSGVLGGAGTGPATPFGQSRSRNPSVGSTEERAFEVRTRFDDVWDVYLADGRSQWPRSRSAKSVGGTT